MKTSFIWSEAKVGEGQRITIGQDIARQLGWLTGSDHIDVWVLTLEPGRYRVIPHSDFETNTQLKQILERLTAVEPDALEMDLESDSPELAVLRSRLLPATISPPASSWRLNLSSVPLLDSTGEEIKRIILVLRQGHIELWSGLRFARAQSTPIDDLLR